MTFNNFSTGCSSFINITEHITIKAENIDLFGIV